MMSKCKVKALFKSRKRELKYIEKDLKTKLTLPGPGTQLTKRLYNSIPHYYVTSGKRTYRINRFKLVFGLAIAFALGLMVLELSSHFLVRLFFRSGDEFNPTRYELLVPTVFCNDDVKLIKIIEITEMDLSLKPNIGGQNDTKK